MATKALSRTPLVAFLKYVTAGVVSTIYRLIQTAKLNDIDPQAWLAYVLRRIADTPQTRLAERHPWSRRVAPPHRQAA
jgi:hypothetical protein